jgi:hypothetical protein
MTPTIGGVGFVFVNLFALPTRRAESMLQVDELLSLIPQLSSVL